MPVESPERMNLEAAEQQRREQARLGHLGLKVRLDSYKQPPRLYVELRCPKCGRITPVPSSEIDDNGGTDSRCQGEVSAGEALYRCRLEKGDGVLNPAEHGENSLWDVIPPGGRSLCTPLDTSKHAAVVAAFNESWLRAKRAKDDAAAAERARKAEEERRTNMMWLSILGVFLLGGILSWLSGGRP